MTQNVPEILVHIGAGAEGIKPKLTHVGGHSYLQILQKSRQFARSDRVRKLNLRIRTQFCCKCQP